MSKGTIAIWDIAIQAANTRKSGRVFATADVFMASPWSNIRDQRLATNRLPTPPDFIASPLHRFVRLSLKRQMMPQRVDFHSYSANRLDVYAVLNSALGHEINAV
jgi:hypothetical protein